MTWQRLAPFLGLLAALAVGVVLLRTGSISEVAYESGIASPLAATTSAVFSAASTTSVQIASTTVATTTPTRSKKPAAATKPEVTVEAPAEPAPTPPTLDPAAVEAALQASSDTLRSALVNIICYAPAGGRLRSISGSGVIIDPNGIILTNAHIAQYFLLADQGVSCSVRGGSPAIDEYRAALLFISPAWIHANASLLTDPAPSGTGEYDFALLGINKSATSAPLPAAFPFVPLATDPPYVGAPVVIASFGAQFLNTSLVQSGLSPTVVYGSVKRILTFSKTTIDVLALGGSAAAQEGSSGGGVSGVAGTLVGTIMTSTVDGATAQRELNALSASYIRADYASETGYPLDLLLSKPVAASIKAFASDAAALESVLVGALGGA